VLWPALHSAVPDAPKTKMFYESASYKQYVAVNQRFADVIISNYREGDISESGSLFYMNKLNKVNSLGQ
jgi:trehalose 6-phosphate synthase/phosphatase